MGVVVVGVDGSTNSIEALRWAAAQCALTGAELRAVFVWEFPYMEVVPGGLGVTLPPYAVMEQAATAKLDEAIATALIPEGVDVERVVREGPPSRLLIEEAKDADLLVVGSRGRGGFLGLLTGSVATQVVNHALVPVVVIRG
jgi:nucleotide-binding universal stress UspA family protein